MPGSIKDSLDVCGHEFEVKVVSVNLHFPLETHSSIGTDVELKEDWINLGFSFSEYDYVRVRKR